MGRRIVEMLTAATEMAEADIEHEFEGIIAKQLADFSPRLLLPNMMEELPRFAEVPEDRFC
jgi:hypothetical protein